LRGVKVESSPEAVAEVRLPAWSSRYPNQTSLLLWQPRDRHRVGVHLPADGTAEFLRVVVIGASAYEKRMRIPRIVLGRDQPSLVGNVRPALDRVEICVANERPLVV
jgi:hypothetical protein